MNALAENTSLNLQTRQVRDLAWACFSPPLLISRQLDSGIQLGNTNFRLSPERQQWLAELDRNPQPLLTHLAASKSPRLGIYFERLWQFFLDCYPAVELLAANPRRTHRLSADHALPRGGCVLEGDRGALRPHSLARISDLTQ